MKIAYVSVFDPLSVKSWSGCSSYLARSFIKDHSVLLDCIGPLSRPISPLLELKRRTYRLSGKNYLVDVDPAVLKSYAQQVERALQISDADFILSLDALPIAYLETRKPVIYYWDCTFLGNLEYPAFKNLAPESVRFGHKMEQLALEKCQFAIFSSEWAAQTALDGYEVDSKKVKVVPLGANLDCHRTIADVSAMVDARDRRRCKLLFIGIDWVRKGGNVAYHVAKQLNAMGLDTTLTVVGCDPQLDEEIPPYIRCLGYIDKGNGAGREKIEQLLAESHFLIVPSVAESFGTVFCEASSFATPSLARKVGGIPTAVRNGVNGMLFERNAEPIEYSQYILDQFREYSSYRALALSSFREFQARLNWTKTSHTIIELSQYLGINRPLLDERVLSEGNT